MIFHEFLVHGTSISEKPRSWQSRQWWRKRQRLLREALLRISAGLQESTAVRERLHMILMVVDGYDGCSMYGT